MPIVFDNPLALLLVLLVVPFLLIGLRATEGMRPSRRWTILSFRAILIVALAVALAKPNVVRSTDNLTTLYVADVSASVRSFVPTSVDNVSPLTEIAQWIHATSDQRPIVDRAGVISFEEKPQLVHMHTLGPLQELALDGSGASGTNISKALQLAAGMLPPDTLGRLVLISDGNQTAGDAVKTAQEITASSDLRIDVVPLTYDIDGETYVAALEAPAMARPGQTIALRAVIESAQPITGRLVLSNGGQRLDLNPDPEVVGVPVAIPAGTSVHILQAPVAPTPVNRFEVNFLPDGPDLVTANNTASAVVATPARGSMLIVTRGDEQGKNLEKILAQADLPVATVTPEQLPTDLLTLQTYDLIILDDIPAVSIDAAQQERLRTYVEEFGGGLLMVGGRLSFGPGGWNNTPLEAMLPVELDPPAELRRSTGALVLVLDKSGSMQRPVGGALASQQQVANESAALAIESLLSGSWVGVVAFDQVAYQVIPMSRKDSSIDLVSPVRDIQPGGGTKLGPAMLMAQGMLEPIDVPTKHIVLLTDGRTDESGLGSIAQEMSDRGISLTTIAVGEEADQRALQELATLGGGAFHEVRNPRLLPRVLVDSVQVINTPLIKETELSVVVRPTGSPLTSAMASAPKITGSIITTPAENPSVQVDLVDSDGDPLLAHRQLGVGRVGTFMSDSGRSWTSEWSEWDGGPLFWTQLVRYLARGPALEDLELITRVDGKTLEVDLQAMDSEGGWLDYLATTATLHGPSGSKQKLELTQTAPGRYQGSLELNNSGDYVLAIAPRHGTRSLAPVITGVSIPPAAEYRFQRSNETRLAEIAAAGKGRLLKLSSPDEANVFAKDDLPNRAALGPLWPVLAWICLALLLLDVAARRLVMMPGALSRATRVLPAPSSLGTRRLQQTKKSIGQRTVPVSGIPSSEIASTAIRQSRVNMREQEAVEPGAVDDTPVETPVSPPTEEELHAALDKLLGKGPAADQPSQSSAPPKEPLEETDGPEGTLDALRRARLKRQQDSDQGT